MYIQCYFALFIYSADFFLISPFLQLSWWRWMKTKIGKSSIIIYIILEKQKILKSRIANSFNKCTHCLLPNIAKWPMVVILYMFLDRCLVLVKKGIYILRKRRSNHKQKIGMSWRRIDEGSKMLRPCIISTWYTQKSSGQIKDKKYFYYTTIAYFPLSLCNSPTARRLCMLCMAFEVYKSVYICRPIAWWIW